MQRVTIKITGIQVGWLSLPTADQAMSQAMSMIDPFQTNETPRPILTMMRRYLDTKEKHAQPG